MKEIWRHLQFDFRRYGWLAAGALVIAFFAPRFGEGLLALVVIPLLVMNHKTVGSHAWWLDRPLNRNRLALAKLVEIAVLCLAVTVVLSVKKIARGFHPGYVALCQLEEIALLAAAFGLTAVLASLSRDLRRYFLLIPVALIAVAGAVTLWARITGFVLDLNPEPEVLRFFPTDPPKRQGDWFLISLPAAAGLLGAFWIQFQTRRMSWTAVLTAIAILAPVYLVTVFSDEIRRPKWVTGLGPVKPIKGHISLRETVLFAERRPSDANDGFRWMVRLPLEIHLNEELAEDEFLEMVSVFEIAAPDDPEGGRITSMIRAEVLKESAILQVAKRTSGKSLDSGKMVEARFLIPLGAEARDWFDRPLAIETRGAYMTVRKARYVGALAFKRGSIVNDGANRIELNPGTSPPYLAPHTRWELSVEVLRPLAEFNPAWRFFKRRESHSLALWDSRNSEAHFSRQSIGFYRLQGVGNKGKILGQFPSFSEWENLPPNRISDLSLLVIRHERSGVREIKIEPETFVIRLPEA